MKYIKESHPAKMSKHVAAKNIDHKSTFALWLPFTLRKRNVIVSKLQKKYWRATQNFGIEVPTLVKHSYGINNEIGPEFWRKSIAK